SGAKHKITLAFVVANMKKDMSAENFARVELWLAKAKTHLEALAPFTLPQEASVDAQAAYAAKYIRLNIVHLVCSLILAVEPCTQWLDSLKDLPPQVPQLPLPENH